MSLAWEKAEYQGARSGPVCSVCGREKIWSSYGNRPDADGNMVETGICRKCYDEWCNEGARRLMALYPELFRRKPPKSALQSKKWRKPLRYKLNRMR